MPERTPHKVYGSPYMPECHTTLPESLVLRRMSRPLWDGFAKAIEYINGLSDKQLWRLREALEALGTTNCGWLEYRLRADLIQHVEWQIKKREADRAASSFSTEALHGRGGDPPKAP